MPGNTQLLSRQQQQFYGDSLFNTLNGPNNTVQCIAIQTDGKVLIGGDFTSYNGTPINRIARINTNGFLDTSFNPGTGPDQRVASIAIQPDGKIVIVGHFKTYNGTSRNYIARLNTNGSLDTSLNPIPGPDDSIISVALQPDGKILVGGRFTSYDGVTRNYIARLLPSGSFDPSFSMISPHGCNFDVNIVAIQTDGKVLIGGYFTSYKGISRNHIARVNADGSLDTSFDIGIGVDCPLWPTVYSIALQPDGKIIIGGYFTSYNGIACNYIARIIGN